MSAVNPATNATSNAADPSAPPKDTVATIQVKSVVIRDRMKNHNHLGSGKSFVPAMCQVNIFGRSAEGRSFAVRTLGFRPWLHVEMPDDWTAGDQIQFAKDIADLNESFRPAPPKFQYQRRRSEEDEDGEGSETGLHGVDTTPIRLTWVDRQRCYGYHADADDQTGKTIKKPRFARLDFFTVDFRRKAYEIFNRRRVKAFTDYLDDPQRLQSDVQRLSRGQAGDVLTSPFRVDEFDQDPRLQFYISTGVSPAKWVHVAGDLNVLEGNNPRKYTWVRREVTAHLKCLVPAPGIQAIAPWVVLSFDLECYSHNGRFPNPDEGLNVVTHVGAHVHAYGRGPEAYKSVVFCHRTHEPLDPTVIADPRDGPLGLDLRVFGSELKMLNAFRDWVVNDVDPDIITGYYINRFDWNYLRRRGSFYNPVAPSTAPDERDPEVVVDFLCFSRFVEDPDIFSEYRRRFARERRALEEEAMVDVNDPASSSSSTATGVNFGNGTLYPGPPRKPGASAKKDRRSTSVRAESKVSYFANNTFIEGRVNYDLYAWAQKDMAMRKLRNQRLNTVSQAIFKSGDPRHSKIDITPEEINGAFEDPTPEGARRRTRVAVYCQRDCQLVSDIWISQMITPNLMEMAGVTMIEPQDVVYKGEQVKVWSLVSSYAYNNGYVVNKFPPKAYDDKYKGATVIPPQTGLHKDPVATLDFNSLYPSIMMAHNLCYSTVVLDEATRARYNAGEYPDGVFAHHDIGPGTRHIFYKASRGLLPTILETLIGARGVAKVDMGKAAKASAVEAEVINKHKAKLAIAAAAEQVRRRDGTDRAPFAEAVKLVDNPDLAKILRNIVSSHVADENDDVSAIREFDVPAEETAEVEKCRARKVVSDGQRVIFNSRQEALKVSCNAVYGSSGKNEAETKRSKGKAYYSCRPIGETVTFVGRSMLDRTAKYITENYSVVDVFGEDRCARGWSGSANPRDIGLHIIYGDSVTGDTPILCRAPGGRVLYETIEKLCRAWGPSDHGDGKEEGPADIHGLEVWTERGWTAIRRVIRHANSKKILRVKTLTGTVCVTEDHSLLRPDGVKVSPKEVKNFDRLLHADLPSPPSCDEWYNEQDAVLSAKYFVHLREPVADGISDSFLNAPAAVRRAFWDTTREHLSRTRHDEKDPRSPLYYAGLYYIACSLGAGASNDAIRLCFDCDGDYDKFADLVLDISDFGVLPGFVYDLETNNHHFAAGVGRLVVHNTDSVMICIPRPRFVEDVRDMRTRGDAALPGAGAEETRRLADLVDADWNDDAILKAVFAFGTRAAAAVSTLFTKPIKLAYEKCYYPYISIGPKQYAGVKFMEDRADGGKLEIKGLDCVRKSTFPFLRRVQETLLADILVRRNHEKAVRNVQTALQEFVDLRSDGDNSEFTFSVKYKDASQYADPDIQVAIAVSRRLEERNPGSGYHPGDRVDYVHVRRNAEGKTCTSKTPAVEKVEDPKFAMTAKLPLHKSYYFERMLGPLFDQILYHIVENAPRLASPFRDAVFSQETGQMTLTPSTFAGARFKRTNADAGSSPPPPPPPPLGATSPAATDEKAEEMTDAPDPDSEPPMKRPRTSITLLDTSRPSTTERPKVSKKGRSKTPVAKPAPIGAPKNLQRTLDPSKPPMTERPKVAEKGRGKTPVAKPAPIGAPKNLQRTLDGGLVPLASLLKRGKK